MEITAKIRIPEQVYRFYAEASRCVQEKAAEDVMADALAAYARMLSGEPPPEEDCPETAEVY